MPYDWSINSMTVPLGDTPIAGGAPHRVGFMCSLDAGKLGWSIKFGPNGVSGEIPVQAAFRATIISRERYYGVINEPITLSNSFGAGLQFNWIDIVDSLNCAYAADMRCGCLVARDWGTVATVPNAWHKIMPANPRRTLLWVGWPNVGADVDSWSFRPSGSVFPVNGITTFDIQPLFLRLCEYGPIITEEFWYWRTAGTNRTVMAVEVYET